MSREDRCEEEEEEEGGSFFQSENDACQQEWADLAIVYSKTASDKAKRRAAARIDRDHVMNCESCGNYKHKLREAAELLTE